VADDGGGRSDPSGSAKRFAAATRVEPACLRLRGDDARALRCRAGPSASFRPERGRRAARHALLAAELIGADSDEAGEIETLLEGDQAGGDQADPTDTSAANDQADTGDQAQTDTPDKAQADSNDQGENEQADSNDTGGDQADHQDSGGSGDQGDSGASGDSGD